jgi:hypothetical protein
MKRGDHGRAVVTAAAGGRHRGRRRAGRGRRRPAARPVGRRVPRPPDSRRSRCRGGRCCGRCAGWSPAERSGAGRFVTGFSGEQYAAHRPSRLCGPCGSCPARGETILLSAAEPLNLTGIVLPGPRVPALPTNSISYVDGAPIFPSRRSRDLTRAPGPLLAVPSNIDPGRCPQPQQDPFGGSEPPRVPPKRGHRPRRRGAGTGRPPRARPSVGTRHGISPQAMPKSAGKRGSAASA